jgi:hypothetical protein
MRQIQYRLAKRNNEYLTQWRYVYGDTKKVSKWWEVWKENYEVVYEYGEWQETQATQLKEEENA